mgnify:CR=1 FL=1
MLKNLVLMLPICFPSGIGLVAVFLCCQSVLCTCPSFLQYLVCNCFPVILPLQPERHMDQTDQRRHFDQRADDGGEGDGGIETEYGDGDGDHPRDGTSGDRPPVLRSPKASLRDPNARPEPSSSPPEQRPDRKSVV